MKETKKVDEGVKSDQINVRSGNRRKILIINPQFQYKLMAYFMGLSLMSIFIFYCSTVYFFYRVKEKGLELDLPTDHLYFKFVSEQVLMMNITFAVASILLLCIIFIGSLYISHRIAGPIYRYTRHVREHLEHGTLKELSFRDGDFFPEIEKEYNDMIHTMISVNEKDVRKKGKKAA